MITPEWIANGPGFLWNFFIRILIATFALTGGIAIFDIKKIYPFFTFKRLISIFLLVIGSVSYFSLLF